MAGEWTQVKPLRNVGVRLLLRVANPKLLSRTVSSRFYACAFSDRPSISSPTNNHACIHNLRLSDGSFGCFRPSSESELRNVSGSLHRLGTRLKNLEIFLKRSTRFLHYWNEWKRPRNCDLISPQKPRLGRPLATGGKTWVPSDRRNRTGNRFRRSSGFLTAILPFSSPLLVFASS